MDKPFFLIVVTQHNGQQRYIRSNSFNSLAWRYDFVAQIEAAYQGTTRAHAEATMHEAEGAIKDKHTDCPFTIAVLEFDPKNPPLPIALGRVRIRQKKVKP